MNRTTARITTATLALGFAVSTATPALANDDDVIHRGGCSDSSDWKLKASPEDGRIEVEGEVDSNVKGQTWRWSHSAQRWRLRTRPGPPRSRRADRSGSGALSSMPLEPTAWAGVPAIVQQVSSAGEASASEARSLSKRKAEPESVESTYW